MDDLTLNKLRDRLNDIQYSEVQHFLHQHHVVDLVTKLQQRGLVNAMYSLDGTHYITQSKLREDIDAEIAASGGRVDLQQLSLLLNVESSHVEEYIRHLVNTQPSLHLIRGELLTSDYFDSLAEEVAEILWQSGQVTLTELCSRFQLPLQCVSEMVRQRLGKSLKATMEDGVLFNNTFIQQQCQVLRGALRAALYPTSLVEIASRHQLPEPVVSQVLHLLKSAGELPGMVEGGSLGTFIPHAYDKARKKAIDDFYRENSYVDYSRVRQLGIGKPSQYLKELYNTPTSPDAESLNSPMLASAGLALSHCFVAISLLHCAAIELDTSAANSVCLPLRHHLPLELDEADVAVVWQWYGDEVPSLIQQFELHGHFAVNAQHLLPQVLQHTEQVAFEDVRSGKKFVSPMTAKQDAAVGRSGRERRDRRGAPVSSGMELQLGTSKIEALIREVLPKGVTDMDELSKVLCQAWQARVSEVYFSTARHCSMGPEERRRIRSEELQKEMEVLWQDIHLYQKGVASFSRHGDSQGDQILQHHLLSTLAARLVHCLALDNVLSMGEDPAADASLEQLLPLFPKAQRMAIAELSDLTSGADVPHFLSEMRRIAAVCNVYLHQWDKRRERQHMQQRRRELVDHLQKTDLQAPELLLTVGQLLYARHFHAMLHAPVSFVSHLIPSLQELADERPPTPHFLSLLMQALSLAMDKETGLHDEEDCHPVLCSLVQQVVAFYRGDEEK